jgi:thioredoxin reductase (NADPH)
MISAPTPSIIDTRREQMFPTLQPFEIERIRRFGEVRSFEVGEPLAKVGEVARGLSIVLAGRVEVIWYDQSGHRASIVTHRAGEFLGELAQLAGRPALAHACAREPVQALIIPPDRLRALLVAEAELGERIMRALILRRVGLLETGAGGPVIVGRAENGDVAATAASASDLRGRAFVCEAC